MEIILISLERKRATVLLPTFSSAGRPGQIDRLTFGRMLRFVPLFFLSSMIN